MINIIFGPTLFLSGVLIISIIVLYGLRFVRPELAREEDFFFVSVGFIYALIMAIHGWRLDPILFLSQILLLIVLVFAGWENVRLRGIIDSLKRSRRKK